MIYRKLTRDVHAMKQNINVYQATKRNPYAQSREETEVSLTTEPAKGSLLNLAEPLSLVPT